MKKIINKTSKEGTIYLDSFDKDGNRKSVYLAPKESATVTDAEANSRQVVAAVSKGRLVVEDAVKVKAPKEKEETLKESEKEETNKDEKSKKKDKTSDKEDK